MSDLKELSQKQIPLERVVPLNSNRLVTFVNHFIISIVEQLNELTAIVDSKLYDLSNQISRCNSNLVILETKLNSITGLLSVPNSDNQINNTIITQNSDQNSGEEKPITDESNNVAKSETTIEVIETDKSDVQRDEEEVEKEEEPEDPRIAKYKKMLQLGVPLGAVHQKMRTEGVDIDLLKT